MFIFNDLAGTGGSIKNDPLDFIVTEIPLYEPCGEGEHVYLKIRRSGLNTKDVEKILSRTLKIPAGRIGIAGLKDKHATTVQWFSIHLPGIKTETVMEPLRGISQFEIISVSRHKNKLKRGHLIGNQFEIQIRDMNNPDKGLIESYLKRMQETGIPNFFGEQRLGEHDKNVNQGREILKSGQKIHTWLDQYLVNSYQSHIFNIWLIKRIRETGFLMPVSGDVFKKHDFGGLFAGNHPSSEKERFEAKEISFAGPLFGEDMMEASSQALEIENHLLSEQNLSPDDFSRARLTGGRRVARIFPEFHSVSLNNKDCCLEFSLPKGSYATVVLNEIMKN